MGRSHLKKDNVSHDVTSASLKSPVVPKKYAEGGERSGVRVESDSFFNRSVFKRHRRNNLKMTTVSASFFFMG